MRVTQSSLRRILLASITALCIGYVGCSRSSGKLTGADAPAPPSASPTETAPTPVSGTAAPQASDSSATPPSASIAESTAPSQPAGARESATSRVAASPELPPPPPRVFTLSSSTPISIYTTTGLSTKTSRAGDAFTGTLARRIVDKDWIVAKDGAPVEGVVVSSDPGGRVKGVASITVALRRLTLADGRRIEISTNAFTQKARTTHGKDAEKIIGGAGVGALIGALAGGRKGAAIGAGAGAGAGTGLVLATRGDPATIAREAHLSFRVKSPVRITRQQRIP
jgi:hypothetical protein